MFEYNFEEPQFIQNRTAGLIEWLSSKGTNYTCYKQFKDSITEAQNLDLSVSTVRTLVGIVYKPLQYTFFYWTMILFILYKFNFKHRVMKLTLIFYTFRTLGELFKLIGDIWPHYFVNGSSGCVFDGMHPRKWLFKMELGNIFSILGEIIGDLYPLLRISEISESKREVIYVFISCTIFNISKIGLAIYNLTLGPENLYNINGVYREDQMSKRNTYYTFIQLIITYASVIYSIFVWIVVRRYINQVKYSEFNSFTKKFKNVPEYRLSCMQIFNIISMLLVSSAGILQMIYYKKNPKTEVDFTMEELRDYLAGLQYFMIFVDQIFLIHSHNVPTSNSTELYSNGYSNKYSSNNGVTSGRFHYENLNYNASNNDPNNNNNNNINNNNIPISNNGFGFLNDNKYKGLTSYSIDYNKYNKMSMNNEWNYNKYK
ncbi:hypothetical protein BCR32DRAFT_268678 [Anaeromyces robustus]|uniref:Uncharacterized protein n=1 Tax=Anaeromyces robustus TaxID=1754192 RepID=A0A1Y1X4M9_9FUNG|nr:hypothetical protein BCR32DRAFT_268678 [Anaeromyces robustus]|eukprot:ORX80767.1 hypothetical protein BCR32DRAFT_268678 [Anaeromyces robustus]